MNEFVIRRYRSDQTGQDVLATFRHPGFDAVVVSQMRDRTLE